MLHGYQSALMMCQEAYKLYKASVAVGKTGTASNREHADPYAKPKAVANQAAVQLDTRIVALRLIVQGAKESVQRLQAEAAAAAALYGALFFGNPNVVPKQCNWIKAC